MAKFLIVDDDVSLSDLVATLLEKDAHQVVQASCGQEAIKHLTAEAFDLIIMDWEMPDLSGPNLLRGYRSRGGQAYVIMLTGKSDLASKEEGFEAGADDYMTKPFSARELIARVNAHLRRGANTAESAKPVSAQLPSAEDSNLGPGKLIADRYLILEKIGEGGMGLVYKVKHKELDKFFALKLMQQSLSSNDAAAKRFEQEAKIMSVIEHPNLVSIIDFGRTSSKQLYFVMEYLEGATMLQWIQKHGKIPVPVALNLFQQICSALDLAHNRGLVHRDLKPANVMLVDKLGKTECKILDMGLAKMTMEGMNLAKTEAGELLGSPFYMSPEQCMADPVDRRSDIYSFGCLMYECLSGKVPFFSDSFMKVTMSHLNEPPGRFREINPEISEELETLVLHCLKKPVNERPQSMGEIGKRLQEMEARLSAEQKQGSDLKAGNLEKAAGSPGLLANMKNGISGLLSKKKK